MTKFHKINICDTDFFTLFHEDLVVLMQDVYNCLDLDNGKYVRVLLFWCRVFLPRSSLCLHLYKVLSNSVSPFCLSNFVSPILLSLFLFWVSVPVYLSIFLSVHIHHFVICVILLSDLFALQNVSVPFFHSL